MHKHLWIAINSIDVLHLLRDPVWQSIGVVVAVILAFLGIVVPIKQRKCKQLSYFMLPQVPIVRGDRDLSGMLEIKFNGKSIRSLCAVSLEILNSGNTAIVPEDYNEPINIIFDKGSQVLSAEVISSKPKNLRVIIDVQRDRVAVSPTLLNAGDAFRLRVLVDRSEVSGGLVDTPDISIPVSIVYRIVDVGEISEFDPQPTKHIFGRIRQITNFFLITWRNGKHLSVMSVAVKPSVLPTQKDRKPGVQNLSLETEVEEGVEPGTQFVTPEEEPLSNIGNYPFPKWEELTDDQKRPYYTSALQWVNDNGGSTPSRRVLDNVALGLWRKDNRVREEIYKEHMAVRDRNTGRKLPEDVKRAMRRLPEEDTKD